MSSFFFKKAINIYPWGGRTLVHAFGGQRTACKDWLPPFTRGSQELNRGVIRFGGKHRYPLRRRNITVGPQFFAYCLAYSKCPPKICSKSNNVSIEAVTFSALTQTPCSTLYLVPLDKPLPSWNLCLHLCKTVMITIPHAMPAFPRPGAEKALCSGC